MKKRMSRLVACLLVFGVALSTIAEANYATYTNEKMGYQIKYPSDQVVTVVEDSPKEEVVFTAKSGEFLSVECYTGPSKATVEEALQYADEMVQGMAAGATKNGFEITIDKEPSLYEAKNCVVMGGAVYNDKMFNFFDVFLMPSESTLFVLCFVSLTKDYADQIKGVADSFTIL